MEVKFTPIKLNDKGNNVKLLHQSLAALKFPVSQNEITQAKAGQDTLKQVRVLQKNLSIRVSSSSILLDAKTILAMISVMTDKGLLASKNLFEVSGMAILGNGSIKKRLRIIAFDLNICNMHDYTSLKDVKEGFEFLGETRLDNNDHYRIRFYNWQYRRAERKLADVVVYAIGDKGLIIGHSRIVNTEDYSDKGFVCGLDITPTLEDKCTKYQANS